MAEAGPFSPRTEPLSPCSSPLPLLSPGNMSEESLFIEVVEGRELVSMDSNGFSDPYVVVLFNDRKAAKTKVKTKTLNPVWKESFTLDVPRSCSEVTVEVWDRDLFKKNDRMGIVKIPLDSLLPFNTSHDEWYTIKPMKTGDIVSGALHLQLSRFTLRNRMRRCSLGGLSAKSQLFAAVENNDLYTIMNVVDNPKVNINEQNQLGNTALHEACRKWENEHIMLTLLRCPEVRADIPNNGGNTALHLFCSEFRNPNCDQVLEGLIARGADVNARNKEGETPLHRAVLNTAIRLMLVERLLARGADATIVTKGGAPVHYAAQLHRPDIIGTLIEKAPQGVGQLELRDQQGRTPAEVASMVGDEGLVTRMRQYRELHAFLEGLPDAVPQDARRKIFLHRLFLGKLRVATEDQLRKIGIEPADLRKTLLAEFEKIVVPEEDRQAMKISKISSTGPPTTPRVSIEGLAAKSVIQPSDVEFTMLLGEGSSAKVYKAIYKDATVAVKVLTGATDLEKKEFIAEYEVVRELESQYVIKFFGVMIQPDRLCMLMEYCELGSLYHVLNNEHVPIRWSQTLSFMEQMLKGLLMLHTHKPPIFHRDLKSLNLLIKGDMTLKMADFGLSRFNTTTNMQTLQRIRGTYAYIAPELFYGNAYTATSDVYSMGIILWELVYRCINQKYQRPYAEYPEIRMDFQIILKTAKENVRPTIPPSTPPMIRNMIQLCVMPQQDGRPECETLLQMLGSVLDAYKEDPAEFEGCIVGGRSQL
eukprot:m51a1_g2175 putative ankyrin repeat-containing protein (759) ;mRNA; f:77335-80720